MILQPDFQFNGLHLVLCAITFAAGFFFGGIYGYLCGRDKAQGRR